MMVMLLLTLGVACGPNWIIPEPPPEDVVEEPGCPIDDPVVENDGGEPVVPPPGLSSLDGGDVVADAGLPTDGGSVLDGGAPPDPEEPDGGTPPDPEEPDGGSGEKVVLCHVPRGNPDNMHKITVGEPALSAHLRHGDFLGECPEKEKKGKKQ